MNIQTDERGIIKSFGLAVDGNLVVENTDLPADWELNAFWKYRCNGAGFDVLKVETDCDGNVLARGFDVEGTECPVQVAIAADYYNYQYTDGDWVYHDPNVTE